MLRGGARFEFVHLHIGPARKLGHHTYEFTDSAGNYAIGRVLHNDPQVVILDGSRVRSIFLNN